MDLDQIKLHDSRKWLERLVREVQRLQEQGQVVRPRFTEFEATSSPYDTDNQVPEIVRYSSDIRSVGCLFN